MYVHHGWTRVVKGKRGKSVEEYEKGVYHGVFRGGGRGRTAVEAMVYSSSSAARCTRQRCRGIERLHTNDAPPRTEHYSIVGTKDHANKQVRLNMYIYSLCMYVVHM